MKDKASVPENSFTAVIIVGFFLIISGLLFFHDGSAPSTEFAQNSRSTFSSLAQSGSAVTATASTRSQATPSMVTAAPSATPQNNADGGTFAQTQTVAATAVPTITPSAAASSSESDKYRQSVMGNQLLTRSQQQFAVELAKQTGLDENVVGAWVLNEQSGPNAVAREAAGNNNWLNIGYTDSGQLGTQNACWFSGPIIAADSTASWMKGQLSIQGFGKAAPGITAILKSVGRPSNEQILALQKSPWATGHYPQLPAIYQEILSHNVYR